jgi:hypothetical protein
MKSNVIRENEAPFPGFRRLHPGYEIEVPENRSEFISIAINLVL